MKKFTNKDAQEYLLSQFPEYADSDDRREVYDNDGPYIYFSYFGDFILREIDEHGDTDLVKRAFNFINDLHAREDLSAEVWDLLGIQLLERLELDEKYKELANKYLSGKALVAFKEQKGRPME